MPEYLTPGVYFEWVDPSAKVVSPLRTDIAAFVGIAESGPVHTPTRIISWQQFQSVFGNFIPNGYLAYSVKAFFENGGRECRVVRVTAPAAKAIASGTTPPNFNASNVDSTVGFARGAVVTAIQDRQTTNAGPTQPADRASSIVTDVSGFPEGALVKISQSATGALAFRHVKAVDALVGPRIYWSSLLDAAFDLVQPANTIKFETTHQTDLLVDSIQGNTVSWESPIPPFYDPTQPIEFETGVDAATGAGVARGELFGEDRAISIAVSASSPGAWGDDLRVRVSRSSTAATRAQPVAQPADRLSSLVDTVSGFLIGSLVRIYQDAAPQPLITTLAVAGVDAARNRIIWDAALAPAYDLVDQSRPLSFETVEFNLSVYYGGQLRETFSGLSLIPDPQRTAGQGSSASRETEQRNSRKVHAEQIVNRGSSLIRITDKRWPHSAADYSGSLPDPDAANLRGGKLALRGGRDGIAALRPRDFAGNPNSQEKRGLQTLEDVDEVAIVAVPDVLIRGIPPVRKQTPPPPPPADPCLPCQTIPADAEPPTPRWVERAPEFSALEIESVQQALVIDCETARDRIALLDPPIIPAQRLSPGVDAVQSWRRRFDSRYAALYFPWVLVYDPLKLGGNIVRAVPPSGHVAGIYARTDIESGVHCAPANAELRWATAASEDVSPEVQGVLNPGGINCLRTLAGRGLRVYGARTVSSDALWRFVNVRRLMMMIEESVETSVQWSVFEPHDLQLRDSLVTAISNFLNVQWQSGALVGNTADEAFFVKCDAENNPPDQVDRGQLVVDVGVAPVRPAEFVVVRVGKTVDGLEITEMRETIGTGVMA